MLLYTDRVTKLLSHRQFLNTLLTTRRRPFHSTIFIKLYFATESSIKFPVWSLDPSG